MDDVMLERIREYRRMLNLDEKPDLDITLLLKILDVMNESSPVRVSIEPVDENGTWSSATPTYSVTGVKRLDDGRLVLRVSNEKSAVEAGELAYQLNKQLNKLLNERLNERLNEQLENDTGKGIPVLFTRGETVTQLTEVCSHALVNEQWAGLPFELVLAVRKRAAATEDETDA